MYFPEIDREKTIKNVDDLLKKYHTFRRISGNAIPQKLTSTLDDMPKSPTHENVMESKLVKKIDCEAIYHDINLALSRLDKDSQNLLWGKYIATDRHSDYERYSQMAISHTTYYQWLNKARLSFAEAYHHGELIEFR